MREERELTSSPLVLLRFFLGRSEGLLEALLEGLEVPGEALELFLEVLNLAAQFADFCRGLSGSLVLTDLVDCSLGGLAFGGLGVGGHEGGEDGDGPGVA